MSEQFKRQMLFHVINNIARRVDILKDYTSPYLEQRRHINACKEQVVSVFKKHVVKRNTCVQFVSSCNEISPLSKRMKRRRLVEVPQPR